MSSFSKDDIALLTQPQEIPNIAIPKSSSTVDVRIINTTSYYKTSTSHLFNPPVAGHEYLTFPSYAFLITNRKEQTNVLFDLGMRKDWRQACQPCLKPYISDTGEPTRLQVCVDKDIRDILDDRTHGLGITSLDIAAVIWSHHHFDHRGDMSRFPHYTHLIVGPGVSAAYRPGFPTDPFSEVNESDFADREVIELTPDCFDLVIGGYPAHDAFGDGSFYLLSSPGHSIGHLMGLARVTSHVTSTFVLLGGDCAHHCGEFRPSPYMPLPSQPEFKSTSWSFDTKTRHAPPRLRKRQPTFCAGSYIQDMLHPQKQIHTPFYQTPPEPLVHSYTDATESLSKMQVFDAHDDILVCISHDPTLMDVLPFFPHRLNDWYQRGHKQKLQWEFLRDFDLPINSAEESDRDRRRGRRDTSRERRETSRERGMEKDRDRSTSRLRFGGLGLEAVDEHEDVAFKTIEQSIDYKELYAC